MRKTPLRRKKPLKPRAIRKNGKPRSAPGKAKGKSLTAAAGMYARQACLEAFGHKCCARGRFGIECGTIGSRAYLERCHIYTRSHQRLTFHPDNVFCACPFHHDWLDAHPAVRTQFVEEILPGRMAKLAELDMILPKGANAKFWCEAYREMGFTTTGRKK